MYKKLKYKLLILSTLICVYIFFPNELYALTQKEVGEAIATFALNFQKALDGGKTWTYDWDSYNRSQAYHGIKHPDGTYHSDCVGWVSMCLHMAIGLDAPNVSNGASGFVVPTIYSQNYEGFGSVIVEVTGQQLMPGDILQNSHHVMIYAGNINGEDIIIHSANSRELSYESFASYASWQESASVDINGVYSNAYRISSEHAATLNKSQLKTTWNGSDGDYSWGEGPSGGSSGSANLENFEGDPNYQVTEKDKKKDYRIVNINDKLPIYKHILLTEKYNFNNIKWKQYGHGKNGTPSPMKSDLTLGVRYPSDDKNTKLGKFVSLTLPYIQTWYIPLSMYSGILNSKGGNMNFGGSGSGTLGGDADYSGENNRQIVWNFLKSKGLSDITAAAVMGNIAREAGEDFNPSAIEMGNNNAGFGLCQWSYGRRTAIVDYAAAHGKEPDDITLQLDFLWLEMSGEDPSVSMQIIGGSLEEFAAIEDLEEATGYFCRKFERPAVNNVAERYESALRVLEEFEGTSGTGGDNSKEEGKDKEIVRSSKNANFPYSLIKNGFHEITVNRYDVQTYTLNTKYKEYVESKKRSVAEVRIITTTVRDEKTNQVIRSNTSNAYVLSCNSDEKISEANINTRMQNGKINPMLEDFAGSATNVDTKYYLYRALTFDMLYTNEFLYTPYSESDANARINADSENVTSRAPYQKKFDYENRFTAANISGNNINEIAGNLNASYDDNEVDTTVNTSRYREGDKMVLKTITTKVYKLKGKQFTIHDGEEISLKRTWKDKLSQAASKEKQLDYEEMLNYNANEEKNNKKETITPEEFEKSKEEEYRKYKVMSKKGEINLIDYMNSNPKIYSTYLNKGSEYSKYMGYTKHDDLLMSYTALKEQIEKTKNDDGVVPYAYFISLGFEMGYSNGASLETQTLSGSGFGWPVDLTGNELSRDVNCIFPKTPAYGSSHGAIDIRYGEGANIIIAAKDGKVISAKENGGYGNSVFIEHADGFYTRYSHLASINSEIVEGVEVKKGQPLGYMGTTGTSTAEHLDFEIYKDGTSHSHRVDPLDYYNMEPEYGTIDPSTITKIPSGYKFVSEKGGGKFSVVGTKIKKDEWVSIVLADASSRGADACFLDKAIMEKFYDTCTSKGVNPEYAYVTAVLEQNLHSSVNNYWGLATPNGAGSAYFGDMLTTLSAYCDLIVSYQDPASGYYASIMAKYEERKAVTENGGANPDGYGTPDTIQGIQSIYSYLGQHVTGDSGTGGFYYMDPAVAGVTEVYATHEEFIEKCRNGGPEHAYGTETTPWEQAGYTAWQAKKKINTAKAIFGDIAGTY